MPMKHQKYAYLNNVCIMAILVSLLTRGEESHKVPHLDEQLQAISAS